MAYYIYITSISHEILHPSTENQKEVTVVDTVFENPESK